MSFHISSLSQLLVIGSIAMISFLEISSVSAFTVTFPISNAVHRVNVSPSVSRSVASATMAESGIPASSSEPDSDVSDVTIPTNLPSECGMDYVPLASMLATGQLAEADQVREVIALAWRLHLMVLYQSKISFLYLRFPNKSLPVTHSLSFLVPSQRAEILFISLT